MEEPTCFIVILVPSSLGHLDSALDLVPWGPAVFWGGSLNHCTKSVGPGQEQPGAGVSLLAQVGCLGPVCTLRAVDRVEGSGGCMWGPVWAAERWKGQLPALSLPEPQPCPCWGDAGGHECQAGWTLLNVS